MDVRTQLAQQIGLLILVNIEQAARIEALEAQLAELKQAEPPPKEAP